MAISAILEVSIAETNVEQLHPFPETLGFVKRCYLRRSG
jgi:hypothetical protein